MLIREIAKPLLSSENVEFTVRIQMEMSKKDQYQTCLADMERHNLLPTASKAA